MYYTRRKKNEWLKVPTGAVRFATTRGGIPTLGPKSHCVSR